MINPRRIRRKLAAGESVFGVTFQLPSAELIEIAGGAGYDYAWIDAEHGSFSLSDIRHMIRAADAVGIDSIVRVPDHSASYIQRVLDLGAAGIMAPHVRTVADATALVAASTYSPTGIRGACPSIRSVGHLSVDWQTDYRAADDDVLIFGLIEDVEGVDNVEDIAAVPGLSGLVFGPFDLGMAMGVHGDVSNFNVRSDHDRVVAACAATGIEYVTAGISWEFGAYPSTGSRIVTVTADRGAIYGLFADSLRDAKGLTDSGEPLPVHAHARGRNSPS